MNFVYFLALCFLLLQTASSERHKHCEQDERCIKKSKIQSKNENSYEDAYKKKYELYVATKDKQKRDFVNKSNATSVKDCGKRKYQLNCSKSWQKAKAGDGSGKNGKVYIKRENNVLLNLGDYENDVKRKNGKFDHRNKADMPKIKERDKRSNRKMK